MITDMKRMRNERGFTLIELLVVIVILGVLAAVVVFAVGGLSKTGNKSACQTETKTLRTAQEAYKSQDNLGNGEYAADAAALVTAELIQSEPTLHSVTSADGATYSIKVVSAKCGTPGSEVGATPDDI